MSRSKTKPLSQPDEATCGPVALKTALDILGTRRGLHILKHLCKTNSNGTTLPNLINAANKCGLWVLAIEWATLKHIRSALKYSIQKPRAIIVDYLYDHPHENTGHYATVAGYSSANGKLVVFDSYTAQKKSYLWNKFLNSWYDFDFKRKKIPHRRNKYKLSRKWYNRLMLIVAPQQSYLPKFAISSSKVYAPIPVAGV